MCDLIVYDYLITKYGITSKTIAKSTNAKYFCSCLPRKLASVVPLLSRMLNYFSSKLILFLVNCAMSLTSKFDDSLISCLK
uniref:Uncharacterized protein n=1 Tax=Octopus bimaculoides TaxID=37653 RepID=A0A0L8HW82_OCTBM